MLSPSPTQQPPAPQPEKKATSTPARPRAGQSPTAKFIKAIFRPILKGLYYLIQGMRKHKLVALAVIIILVASYMLTTYAVTRALPFGIGATDPLQSIATHDPSSADHIRDWIYALRDGNANRLKALQANMLQTNLQPDADSLVSRYGQPQTGISWVSIEVIGVHAASDTSLDSFIEVNLGSAGGSKTTVGSILLLHFTTVPSLQGRIFVIDVMPSRQYLQ